MGWFSESESDDEQKKKSLPLHSFHTNTDMSFTNDNNHGDEYDDSAALDNDGKNISKSGEDEEDVDPLDAYMNTLETTRTTTTKLRAERLDLSNNNDDDHDYEQQHVATSNNPNIIPSGTDEQQQQQQQQQFLLKPIDHSQMEYTSFERNFMGNKAASCCSSDENYHLYRNEHDISVSETIYNPLVKWEEWRGLLPESLMQNVQVFNKPTPIQAQCVPVVLSGRDIIGIAGTGSGKTFAFLWPMMLHCLHNRKHISANPTGIILLPTRELANQIYKNGIQMAKGVIYNNNNNVPLSTPLSFVSVCGGRGRYEMIKELKKGCDVVISTPGRLIDMIKNKGTSLCECSMVVLDEADKMLDMGFRSQIECLLMNMRPDRQVLMFSATFKRRVHQVAGRWLQNPVRIEVGKAGTASKNVTQHVMVLKDESSKMQWMSQMLPVLAGLGKLIIFTATKVDCESITQLLIKSSGNNLDADQQTKGEGLVKVASIHGDKHQIDRNAAFRAFKEGKLAALVATDVASRGLDVDNVKTVVNYDPAKNMDAHVHRVGRAGRLSKNSSGNDDQSYQKGTSYTLLTPKDKDFANSLLESFRREGRDDTSINQSLVDLAKTSKFYKHLHHSRRIVNNHSTPVCTRVCESVNNGDNILTGFVRASTTDCDDNVRKRVRQADDDVITQSHRKQQT